MVNLEELEAHALRAYEVGRFRVASRVILLLAPIIALCLLETRERGPCACCAALLLVASIWLRWQDRAGVEHVTTGLLAGGIPLAFAFVLRCIDPHCASAGVFSYCTAISILLGGVTGTIAALRARGANARGSLAFAAAIAALAASLGCFRLGLASVVGVVVGIVLGSASVPRDARA